MKAQDPNVRAAVLLALGTVVGVGLAWGAIRSAAEATPQTLAPDSVARINDTTIPAEAFERVVASVAAERGVETLGASERARVLEDLVDEEILLQGARALGLAEVDPAARRAIVSAMASAATGDSETEEPGEDELRRFHAAEIDRFREGEGGPDAAFEDVRERVRREWLRVQGERALGVYLSDLRSAAGIEVRLPGPERSGAR